MRKNISYKIKKLFKDNILSLVILILFGIFCFYDTGYSIYRTGGIINASERVTGNNLYESNGSFNMAYVNMMKGKLPFYLLAKILPDWELIKNENLVLDDTENLDDVYLRDNLYFKEAINNATLVAFKEANVNYEIVNNNYYVIYKTKENNSDLNIGDIVLSYDGNEFITFDDFTKYIDTKQVGDTINIKYQRDGKEKTTLSTIYENDNKLYIGLSFIHIIETNSNYNLKIESKNSESGPSGGLITALSIYNALTNKDLTNGKKIVGTGTIDLDGKVGEIGGIKYKLASAVKNKADIFLCPKENYDEAIKYAKEKKYNIIIKEVNTFKEAIEYLQNIN